MNPTPPSPGHSRASLAAALDRVDAALAEPDGTWLDRLASLGVWGAWLRWMLQLLACQFAGDEPWRLPGADTPAGSARAMSGRVLDRQIDRLIEAAARLWTTDGQTPARQPRRRRRNLLQLVLRWRGYRHHRLWPTIVRISRVRSAPVLALCQPAGKPEGRSGADSDIRPCPLASRAGVWHRRAP